MENEMQNRTENSPLIPPVMHGRTLEYATEIEVFRSEISKAGLSLPNEIIDDGRIHRFSSNGKKIYFDEDELVQWLKRNPARTQEETEAKAASYIVSGKASV